MKVNDPADAGSPRVIGKEFLIVIVVICSAVSFSLGYFVGISYRDKGSATAIPALAPDPSQPPAMTQVDRAAGPAAPAPQQADGRQEQSPTNEKGPAGQQGPQQKAAPAGREGTAVVGIDRAAAPEAAGAYTVQLGALKNPGEARRLKERLSRKGFKTTIVVAKNEKNEKIYKVRTGEFTERREAEALAAKLKKSEGLNAFVTPKQE